MSLVNFNDYNSYSEWRKALFKPKSNDISDIRRCKAMSDKFKDFIGMNSRLYSLRDLIGLIGECIQLNIDPNYLVVGLLYSSYHVESPHTTNLLSYLLLNYNNIDLMCNSVSPPKFTIAHVSAVNNDIKLLQIYFNKGGNINAIDIRKYTPIHIAIGNQYYSYVDNILWMDITLNNDVINKITKMVIKNFTTQIEFVSLLCCFNHFKYIIHISQDKINELFNDIFNSDIINIITSYTLPMTSIKYVNTIIDILKSSKTDDKWSELNGLAISKLKEINKHYNFENDTHIHVIGVDYANMNANKNIITGLSHPNIFDNKKTCP